MYSAKCGSALLAYWWLSQLGLLDISSRFSLWSHEFEEMYRRSSENIINELTFVPKLYAVYKFTRDPFRLVVSSFRHLLRDPEFSSYRVSGTGVCFNKFLDDLANRNYCDNEIHFTPQLTAAEWQGIVTPVVLKIEDGIDQQIRMVEQAHGLPPTDLNSVTFVRQIMREHLRLTTTPVHVGPDDVVKFGQVPKAQGLFTKETIEKTVFLYSRDFQAYGYPTEPID
jgi:hypothetical protein